MRKSLFKLFALRWRLWWNTFKHRSLGKKIGYAFGLLALLAFAGALIFASWGLLRLLNDPDVTAMLAEAGVENLLGSVLDQIPVFLSMGAFFIGGFASFSVLLQNLYLAGDMEFLLVAPLPPRAVFLSKLGGAVFPSLILITVISGPALVGLGLAQNYTALYYVLVPLVLASLVISGAALSSLIVMVVVRVMAPRRAAEILGLVGGLSAFICSQSGQFATEFTENVDVSAEQMADAAGLLAPLVNAWNPLSWPGRGLSAIGQAQWGSGLLFTGLSLALMLGVFTIALTTAERLYFGGWARVQVGTTARKKRQRARKKQTGRASTFSRLFPAPVWAVMRKDARLYRRDLRNLSQLIFPVIIAVIWTIYLIRGSTEIAAPQQVRQALDFGALGIAMFVSWSFVSRFGMGGFSMEGRQWWIIKTSPISTKYLVLAKYFVTMLPSAGFGVIYLLVASFIRSVSVSMLGYQMLALVLVVAGQSALMLAFGIWGVRFDWNNPNEYAGGVMGCLGSLIGMLYLGLTGGALMGLPIFLEFIGVAPLIGFGTGLLAGAAVCALMGALPLLFAVRRIPRMGEAKEK